MKLGADFSFAGSDDKNVIVLEGFFPEAKGDGLHLHLKNGRYNVVVYMSNRRRQQGNITDPPTAPGDLKNHMTLMVRGLTVEIEDTDPDPEVVADLKAEKFTKKTENYAVEATRLINQIHNGIVEFFRNYARQIWLEPIVDKPTTEKTLQYIISELNLRWQDDNGEWQPFTVNGPAIAMSYRNDFGDPVNREEWKQVGPFVERFIEEGKQAGLRGITETIQKKALREDETHRVVVSVKHKMRATSTFGIRTSE